MDISKIQAKLDSLQNPKKGNKQYSDRSVNFWKPTIGKHLIRFVPNKQNPEIPFTEVYFHYGIGPKVMSSPINYGEKDPIVEFAKGLKKSKDPEDWKLAKKLDPKMRIFAPVIVRGEEEKGVRLYEFGKSVYQELLALAADEEVGDFTDVLEGRDIKVDVTAGNPYQETSVRPTMKSTPATKDQALLEQWLEKQPDVLELYKKYTFDEVKEFLTKWLNPEEESGTVDAVSTTERNEAFSTQAPKQPTSKSKPKEVITESEFDEIFKED